MSQNERFLEAIRLSKIIDDQECVRMPRTFNEFWIFDAIDVFG